MGILSKWKEWKRFKMSFPFVCTSCHKFTWEMREICENCGEKNTLRETNREDWEKFKERRR